MKKVITWVVDKWLAGFITTSLFFLLKVYYDLPKTEKGNFFQFEWFTSIINTKVEVWKSGLLIAFFLGLYAISQYIKKVKAKPEKDVSGPIIKIPEVMAAYRRDSFGKNKAEWVWRYQWNSDYRRWVIDDVRLLCRVCDTALDFHNDIGELYGTCSKCRLEGRAFERSVNQNPSDVKKEIFRRLRAKLDTKK